MDRICLWRWFQQICGAEILNRNLQIKSRRIKVMFYRCRRAEAWNLHQAYRLMLIGYFDHNCLIFATMIRFLFRFAAA